jgi:antirestriction protein
MSTTEQSAPTTKTTTAAASGIQIYFACLAAYNNGYLHGSWIDATRGANHVREEIDRMLSASPIPGAEEYAIHDYEGFEGARIEEYSGIDEVCTLAEFIGEHGALGGKLLEHFGDLESAREAIEDHYAGCYASVADFVQELTEETTAIPEPLRYYIDWRAIARDMEINDILAIETGFEETHIFWRH